MKPDRLKGLTSEQVKISRIEYGKNVITSVKGVSAWSLLADKFKDPIIQILLVAAILSLLIVVFDKSASISESLGTLFAVFLATGVGFWFEWDAKKRFDELNRTSDDHLVKVRRDGNMSQIHKAEVVVGDLVWIESGEMIPADGELLEAVSLRVNESSLTGESETGKTIDSAHFDTDATYPSNMLLSSTTVADGYGVMVVTAVGDSTEYGRVARASTIDSGEQTPLGEQLERLSKMIGRWGVALSVGIFIVLVAKGVIFADMASQGWLYFVEQLLHVFMIAVAMIAMAVPEGLPMSITLSLALSMRRMLKTNNLVRNLHACETMGAATVICTDKTGTLTQNRMQVEAMDIMGGFMSEHLYQAIATNTTAFLDSEGQPIGNPTEGALLMWLSEQEADYVGLRETVKVIDRITFTTERKYMATLVETHNGERRVYVKGASEIIYSMCEGSVEWADINIQLLEYQRRACRTLGFVWGVTSANTCQEAIDAGGLEFMAITAIADPVRQDVPLAVAKCLDAGIKVKIVTGDTPATASEIASQIGLWRDEQDRVRNSMTGVEFASMSDEELLERVADLKVLSRARPMDKQRLVQLLQRCGEVVAVTGDGTNDAPALKAADVGLSMGSGTSVSKEASDITLLDDSFGSIVTAVMWGRSLYDNIRRFVIFQLTINFTAIAVVFVASLFGSELPLTVTQILWVNLIMDTFAAMAMASLPPRESVLNKPPRRNSDFIISHPMLRVILGWSGVFTVLLL